MGVSFSTQHPLMNCARFLGLTVLQAAAVCPASLCRRPPPGFKERTSIQVRSGRPEFKFRPCRD